MECFQLNVHLSSNKQIVVSSRFLYLYWTMHFERRSEPFIYESDSHMYAKVRSRFEFQVALLELCHSGGIRMQHCRIKATDGVEFELVASDQLFSVVFACCNWFKISAPGVEMRHMWQLDRRFLHIVKIILGQIINTVRAPL